MDGSLIIDMSVIYDLLKIMFDVLVYSISYNCIICYHYFIIAFHLLITIFIV